MRKLLTLVMLSASLLLSIPILAPVSVAAQSPVQNVRQGVNATGRASSGPNVQEIIRLVINILSWVVGIAAVIMIIIGGLRYVLSGGDSTGVNNAKNTILYALIGLVIVAMAQILVRFVLERVS